MHCLFLFLKIFKLGPAGVFVDISGNPLLMACQSHFKSYHYIYANIIYACVFLHIYCFVSVLFGINFESMIGLELCTVLRKLLFCISLLQA